VQAHALLASGCTAIAYETVTGPGWGLPQRAPMSEVDGRMAMLLAPTGSSAHREAAARS
jgi:alanine dehydrogenase